MFFDDHKKAITTMMGKRNSKGERTMDPTPMVPQISKDEDGTPDGLHMAAEDILGAHRANDAGRLKEAMQNFMDLHVSKSNDTEYPDKE